MNLASAGAQVSQSRPRKLLPRARAHPAAGLGVIAATALAASVSEPERFHAGTIHTRPERHLARQARSGLSRTGS